MTYTEIAIDFLLLAATKDVHIAFERYVDMDRFKHHNAYFAGDAQTLLNAMRLSAVEAPDKIIDIQQTISQDQSVAIHSWIRQNQEDRGAAVIHIFRFEGDKIVELWDFGQAVPKYMENENGMF